MKKNYILKTVLIFIALILISGTVYSAWRINEDISKITKNIDQIEVTQKEAKKEIDTSEWKFYRNEEYGFELKYPTNFSYWETYTKNKKIPEIVSMGFRPENIQGSVLTISILDISLNKLIDDYNGRYGKPTNKKIEIGGRKGIKFSGYLPRMIGIEKGNYTYYFTCDGIRKEDKQIFDQILSTFKFIELGGPNQKSASYPDNYNASTPEETINNFADALMNDDIDEAKNGLYKYGKIYKTAKLKSMSENQAKYTITISRNYKGRTLKGAIQLVKKRLLEIST